MLYIILCVLLINAFVIFQGGNSDLDTYISWRTLKKLIDRKMQYWKTSPVGAIGLNLRVQPMSGCRYVEEIGSAAMLAAKRSSGVVPEVNLRECVRCMRLLSVNKAAYSGFETQRRRHYLQVQNRGISGPTIRTRVLQTFKLKKNKWKTNFKMSHIRSSAPSTLLLVSHCRLYLSVCLSICLCVSPVELNI